MRDIMAKEYNYPHSQIAGKEHDSA